MDLEQKVGPEGFVGRVQKIRHEVLRQFSQIVDNWKRAGVSGPRIAIIKRWRQAATGVVCDFKQTRT